MKFKSLLVVLFSILVFSACEKEGTIVPNQDSIKIVDYNDENTTPVPWSELPQEIQDAPIINNNEIRLVDLTTLEDHSRSNCRHFDRITQAKGGNGGSSFLYYPNSPCDRIHAIVLRSGALIDALLLVYVREDGSYYSQGMAGGKGGTFHAYGIDADEHIFYLGMRTGTHVDRLMVSTNKKSFDHGGWGGSYSAIWLDQDEHVLGFYGMFGNYVNRLGSIIYKD